MKMLLIHADSMEFWKTRSTKIAEEGGHDSLRVENATIVFTAVEPGDSGKTAEAVDAIKEVMKMQHSEKALLYPYAHLSDTLSSPKEAVEVLNTLAEKLGCERAPFGWYKKFHLHAKGQVQLPHLRRNNQKTDGGGFRFPECGFPLHPYRRFRPKHPERPGSGL